MLHYFHRHPETMIDLTPSELDSLVKSTAATLRAIEQAGKS